MLVKTCRHWASKSPAPTMLPSLSPANCPATNKNSDALTRVICEYWPMGFPRTPGFTILISGMWASQYGVGGLSRPNSHRARERAVRYYSIRLASAAEVRDVGGI